MKIEMKKKTDTPKQITQKPYCISQRMDKKDRFFSRIKGVRRQ